MNSAWELKIATDVPDAGPGMCSRLSPAWEVDPGPSRGSETCRGDSGRSESYRAGGLRRPSGERGVHLTAPRDIRSRRSAGVPSRFPTRKARQRLDYRHAGPFGRRCQYIFTIYYAASLAGGRQRELASPARQERRAQRAVCRLGQLAIARDDGARLAARLLEQAGVAQQIRRLELGEPRLARAEELAGAAQLEVDLGDAEAVVG